MLKVFDNDNKENYYFNGDGIAIEGAMSNGRSVKSGHAVVHNGHVGLDFGNWANEEVAQGSHALEKSRFQTDELSMDVESLIHRTNTLTIFTNETEEPSTDEDSTDVDFEASLGCIFAKDNDGGYIVHKARSWKEVFPNNSTFEILLGFLNLDDVTLQNLIFDLNEKDCYPWHNPHIINESIPFLEIIAKYDSETFDQIITHCNCETGEYPLDNPKIRKSLSHILAGPSRATLAGDRKVLFDRLVTDADKFLESMEPFLKTIDYENLRGVFEMENRAISEQYDGQEDHTIAKILNEILNGKQVIQSGHDHLIT